MRQPDSKMDDLEWDGMALTSSEVGLFDPLPSFAVRGTMLYGDCCWKDGSGPPVKAIWVMAEFGMEALEGCTFCAYATSGRSNNRVGRKKLAMLLATVDVAMIMRRMRREGRRGKSRV